MFLVIDWICKIMVKNDRSRKRSPPQEVGTRKGSSVFLSPHPTQDPYPRREANSCPQNLPVSVEWTTRAIRNPHGILILLS